MTKHKPAAGSTDTKLLGQTLGKLIHSFGPAGPSTDSRHHHRVPTHGLVKLVWRDSADEEQQANVDALNACPLGLAIRSPSAVEIGRTVVLSDGRAILSGLVRRCTPECGEFAIGIEVQRLEDCHELSLRPAEDARAVAPLADAVRPGGLDS